MFVCEKLEEEEDEEVSRVTVVRILNKYEIKYFFFQKCLEAKGWRYFYTILFFLNCSISKKYLKNHIIFLNF